MDDATKTEEEKDTELARYLEECRALAKTFEEDEDASEGKRKEDSSDQQPDT